MFGDKRPVSRIKRSVQGVLGLLLMATILSSGCQAKQKELAAEQKLDQLLGRGDQAQDLEQVTPGPLISEGHDESPSDPFSFFPNWAKSMVPGQPDIQVKEEVNQYRILVRLSNPKDANSVKITVLPHRVEVSGQSSFGKDGMEGSSSFFKSFTTSPELVPSQMKREQHDQKLEFLIPKKVASQPLRENNGSQTLPAQPETPAPALSPEVLEQLNNSENRAI